MAAAKVKNYDYERDNKIYHETVWPQDVCETAKVKESADESAQNKLFSICSVMPGLSASSSSLKCIISLFNFWLYFVSKLCIMSAIATFSSVSACARA